MRFRRALTLTLLALSTVFALPDDPEAVAARLGAEDVDVREKATHDLLRMGSAAQAAVMNAAASRDPEIAARGKAILANLIWPDAGKPSGGLQLAVRAEEKYAAGKPVSLRARLVNTTDKEIVVAGAEMPRSDEYMHLLLVLDGGDELHMCYHADLPYPAIPANCVVPAHDFVEFEFYPNAWCAQPEHSKCSTVQLTPGAHTLKIALELKKDVEGAWKGKISSNEVKFTLEK